MTEQTSDRCGATFEFDRSCRGVGSNRVRVNWDSSEELHDSSTMRKDGTARLAPWAHNLPVRVVAQ